MGEWTYSSTHLGSQPGHFTPKEEALGTHWIGGWVGPRSSLDALVKRKNSCNFVVNNLY